VAGAIAANVMLAALALYSGWLAGMEREYERYFRWVSLVLVTPALLGPGTVFFRSAFGALRARTLHMDVPIALALAAGYVRGAINTVTDRGPIYFDGVAALIFLLLVGRFLQQRAQRAAQDSAGLLHALSPAVARVIEDGEAREVPAESLLPGMTIEVRAGETLPADGVVVGGDSRIDRSLLSGESRPVAARSGDRVFAGTLNLGAGLRVAVEQAGEASRVGRMMREVAAAAARRAPVARLADRIAGGFVAVVLALAAVTAALWMGRDPSAAVDHAIALLIVTCPCALALATPLAVTVAIGRAARAGILVKGGDALERLAAPATLVLDKTGTLTEGRVALASWSGPDEVKPLVLALERHSAHPIAAAFAAAWPGVEAPEAAHVRQTLGGGLAGEVGGRRVVVGSPAFVASEIGAGRAGDSGDARLTPVAIAVDGRIVARAGLGDRVRADAAATLRRLERMGHEVRVLSGDDAAVAQAVARELGIPATHAEGGASPERKLAAIEALERRGPVVMVGDGVNDAAAIARASVGVAVRGGAEASLAAADVFLARPGLAGLVALTTGARRTLGVIRRNILFSLAYNLIGAGLAIAGLIHPLLAAILMPASSLTVVIASWRSRTFDPLDAAAVEAAHSPEIAPAADRRWPGAADRAVDAPGDGDEATGDRLPAGTPAHTAAAGALTMGMRP
jgi:Cu2+-exporting ATPase